MRPFLKFFSLFLLIFAVDQSSKWAAWHYFSAMRWQPFFPFGGQALFENFYGIDGALVNHANKGAAFGLFADHQEFLLGFRLALVLAMSIWLLFINKIEGYLLPVSLILSGALSNIIDYFFYGHVVDLFYFRFWGYAYPVFNVADSVICIGTGLLLLHMLRAKKA